VSQASGSARERCGGRPTAGATTPAVPRGGGFIEVSLQRSSGAISHEEFQLRSPTRRRVPITLVTSSFHVSRLCPDEVTARLAVPDSRRPSPLCRQSMIRSVFGVRMTAITLSLLLQSTVPGGPSCLTSITELQPAGGLHTSVAPAKLPSLVRRTGCTPMNSDFSMALLVQQ